MSTIDLPLGELVKAGTWGEKVYVYEIDVNDFAITKEKLATLESSSPRKFEAKAVVKDGEIRVALPAEFARQYLWERKAQLYLIDAQGKDVVLVASEPESVSKDLNSHT
jgi:hypothetical protein